jgi:hypothetical protein
LRCNGLWWTEVTAERPADREQLVNAMGTAVTSLDGRAAMFGECGAELRIAADCVEMTAHFEAAAGDQKVFAGRE